MDSVAGLMAIPSLLTSRSQKRRSERDAFKWCSVIWGMALMWGAVKAF